MDRQSRLAQDTHSTHHKSEEEEKREREEGLDKTLEESFPASDPLSSIPDPEDEDSAA